MLCYVQDLLENQSTVILKNSTELLSYVSRLWFLLTQQLLPLEPCKRYVLVSISPHTVICISYIGRCVTYIHLYQAHVFRSPSGCAAFLANYNSNSYAKVVFNNEQYSLPPWSISILPDCKNVVFNSATVSFTCAYFQYGTFSSSCISPRLFPRTVWWPGLPDCNCLPLQVGVQTSQMQMWGDGASSMMWERYDEEVDSLAAAPLLTTTGLLEQLNVTRDSSDYLWYITR